MNRPVSSIDQMSDFMINDFYTAQGITPHHWDKTDITFNTSALSHGKADIVEMAFAAWQDVSGLKFTETTGKADIVFRDYVTYAEKFPKAGDPSIIESAVVNIDYQGGHIDPYNIHIPLHEIGHALGLGHTGHYNGQGSASDIIFANDTLQFSAMSYRPQKHYDNGSNIYPITPQMADILAMQKLYGAGVAREGDTTYGFNASGHDAKTAKLYDFNNFPAYSRDSAPALTIYDTGGIDTLDVSSYYKGYHQTISLIGGTWSDIAGNNNNIGIYTTTVIENAIAGGGNDTLIGNAVDNELTGGRGRDILTGGAGDDTFIFAPHFGHDRITDFEAGAGAGDVLELDATLFANFAALQDKASQVGSNTVITVDHHNTITLENVALAHLHADDVFFAA